MGRGYDGSAQPQLHTPAARTERERRQLAVQRRSAARVVATGASNARDCRTLLDMLGLNPQEGLTT